MNKKPAEDLTKLILDSIVADQRITWTGEGRFAVWLFLDQLYKQGFEISVRKK